MRNTKIIVLHRKEITYTLVFLLLLGIFLFLFFRMFHDRGEAPKAPTVPPGETNQSPEEGAALYVPGVYHETFLLGETSLDLTLTVDSNHINALCFTELKEETKALYPLAAPALEHLADQLIQGVPLQEVSLSPESKYTETLLMETLASLLEKAEEKGTK